MREARFNIGRRTEEERKSEIRNPKREGNPKSESRTPEEARMPKLESGVRRGCVFGWRTLFGFRASGFFRISDFGLRISLLLLCVVAVQSALGEQRFPPPDFQDHQLPITTTPPARALWLQYGDVAVLVVTLLLASWFALKLRSRKAMLGLSFFSMLYFGFYREGCICAIGSPQNVVLALFSSTTPCR
jgi:hypothetical protein